MANLVIMLAMIVALAYWGFETVDGTPGWLLGISATAVAIAVWGAFLASETRWPVSVGVQLAIDLNAPTAGNETRSAL